MQANSGRSEGAIREAGGAFGKKEAAQEEQYFRKLVSSEMLVWNGPYLSSYSIDRAGGIKKSLLYNKRFF
jgi:hypothetical protein